MLFNVVKSETSNFYFYKGRLTYEEYCFTFLNLNNTAHTIFFLISDKMINSNAISGGVGEWAWPSAGAHVQRYYG